VIVYKKKSQSDVIDLTRKRTIRWWKLISKKIEVKWWIVLVVVLVIGGWTIINKKNIPARLKLKVDVAKEALITGYYRLTVKPKESLLLDIGFKEIQEVQEKRKSALNQGVLFSSSADLVPADIRYKDENIPVKIRLKGDWLDHLQTNKWSLRVETDEDIPFKGMRRFSLQVPESRNFINEWLFLKTIKDEGLISLNYDFLKVTINGESQGIYALEEHTSKEVIERNEKREGPILKFNADQFWQTVSRFGGKSRFTARESLVDGYYFKSLVETFQQAKIEEDLVLADLLQTAINKLQAFREGSLSPNEVFDYEAWSKYLVLADLFGADHGFFWENYRLYYNPVTGLFEPIPFDNEPGKMIEYLAVHEKDPEPLSQLFSDEEFNREYVKQLIKYSDQSYIGGKISQYAQDIDYYTKLLRQDYPGYSFDPMNFFENADFMKQSIIADQGVRVLAVQGTVRTQVLKVENLLKLPVEILGVKDADANELLSDRQVIKGTAIYELPEEQGLRLRQPISTDEVSLSELMVSYRLLGLTKETDVKSVGVSSSLLNNMNFTEARSPESVNFIRYDASSNTYVIPKGNWNLNSLVKIPAGRKLYVAPGAKVNVTNNGGIVSLSSVDFDGNEISPIVFTSSDNQGQGLLVMKANEKSRIKNTKFIGLKPIENSANKTLGAVNFYESDVTIDKTELIGNLAEDQLNIIRSEFLIKDSGVIKAMSDGADFDFSKGKIINSSFVEMANDGVDFSGSVVEIEGLLVDGAGDKGISVGERSQILVNKTTIRNTRLGVASKDLSEVTLDKDIIFENLEVGLAAYQKKPEYGPALINQDLIKATGVKTSFLIEKGSMLQQPWNTMVKGTEKNLGEMFQ